MKKEKTVVDLPELADDFKESELKINQNNEATAIPTLDVESKNVILKLLKILDAIDKRAKGIRT